MSFAYVVATIFLQKRKEFTTRVYIKPDDWNAKKQISVDKQVNRKLSLIKNEINQAFLFLEVNKGTFDVDDIYLQYKGDNIKADKTILEVFELHNTRILKLVGKTHSKSTYDKFEETKNHVAKFIRASYKKRDLLLRVIKMKFMKKAFCYPITS